MNKKIFCISLSIGIAGGLICLADKLANTSPTDLKTTSIIMVLLGLLGIIYSLIE